MQLPEFQTTKIVLFYVGKKFYYNNRVRKCLKQYNGKSGKIYLELEELSYPIEISEADEIVVTVS